jgi:tetratricopeptide (TPR) repeat protein
LPSPLYNDLSAGGYLTWSEPVEGGVFIDGRLEVYDAAFFDEYRQAMAAPHLWGQGAVSYGYQTAIIFHRWPNRRALIRALEDSATWKRVYVDEVAVVFVKTAGNGDAIARARVAAGEWNVRNDERLARRAAYSWQVPTERLVGLQSYASVLGVLGDSRQAAKRLTQALEFGPSQPAEVDLRVQAAYHKAVSGDREGAVAELELVLEIAPDDTRAKSMLAKLGASNVAP